MERIVIIGATSAIAKYCARLWGQMGKVDMTLVGRDQGRLERVAMDLKVRHPDSRFHVVRADFLDPLAIQALVDQIAEKGPVDKALIAHGFLPIQTECENDLQACHDALEINGVSPALYAEAFARHMARIGRGTVIIIGSVAGDRGRKSNYVYGAAKGLLARYAQGMRHRFAGTKIKVILVKPGPTDTPMTAHLKAQGKKLATVEEVARRIVRAAECGQGVVYAPGLWRWIMGFVVHIPEVIFNRIDI